jgi:hypothetical protein
MHYATSGENERLHYEFQLSDVSHERKRVTFKHVLSFKIVFLQPIKRFIHYSHAQ